MPPGAFKVTYDENKYLDIVPQEDAPTHIPPEQITLKDEVLETQTVLHEIYKKEKDKGRFSDYYQQLVQLAQVGLTGPTPRTELARRDLINFQDTVTIREAGRVKHRYLKKLGRYAAGIGVPCLLVATVLYLLNRTGNLSELNSANDVNKVVSFLYLWSGCMTGVWLSFGIRRPTLQFFDLHTPEPDLLHPLIRLLFAGLLTTIISLLLVLKAVSIGIAGISTDNIYDNGVTAWLVGALCGVSEQLLSQQVTQNAGRLFGNRSSATPPSK
jgi:hypothetical protein